MPDNKEVTVDLDLSVGDDESTLEADEPKETEDSAESEESTETEETDTEEETDEESEETDSESTKTETDDGDLGDTEWLKQFEGMPEGIKSSEDLATSYVDMLKEMKRTQTGDQKLQQLDVALKSRGFASGVDGLLTGEMPQTNQPAAQQQQTGDAKSYFNTTPVKGVVEAMIEDGRIKNTEESPANKETYKQLAQLFDGAIGPELKKFETVYTEMGKQQVALAQKIRDLEWGNLDKSVRDGVNRADVDRLLDLNLLPDYPEAIRYLAFNKPDLLKDLANKAENKGREQGLKKLKRSSKSIKRGKQQQTQTGSFNYGKFLKPDGEWDMNLMGKTMSVDKQLAMIERYEKEHGQN
jgi:hypothetical protein